MTAHQSDRWHASDIAYCSNVHPGETTTEIEESINHFLMPVRRTRGLDIMRSGLWISAIAAHDYQKTSKLKQLQTQLQDNAIQLTTLNGFPYGDFHQDEVKTSVYKPDWSDPKRLHYSQNLARILAACLPDELEEGTISTLPLGYADHWSIERQHQAELHLGQMLHFLDKLYQSTGKHIRLCLEMEPGCVLETSDQTIQFFNKGFASQALKQHYLGLCYDVCHQAVLFEPTKETLEKLTWAGIVIGKIQLSCALEVDFSASKHALEQIKEYAEPKYLHQVRTLNDNGKVIGTDDLIGALEQGLSTQNPWRIHYHVPLHSDALVADCLRTTRTDLYDIFDYLAESQQQTPHLEVETYTWHVLPVAFRPHNDNHLIKGLSDELIWVEKQLETRGLLRSNSL
jgi:hypothetical protein